MSDANSAHDDALLKTLAQILGVPEGTISEETTYQDVERWDSLRQIIIANSLEQVYQIQLTNQEMARIVSVKSIRQLLADKSASAATSAAVVKASASQNAQIAADTTLAELRVRLNRSLALNDIYEAADVIRHSPDRDNWTGATAKIAVVGSLTIDFVVSAIACAVFQEGVLPTFYEAPFGSMVQEALNPASGLYSAKPDVVVLAPDWRDWISAVPANESREAVEKKLQDCVRQFRGLWDQLAANLRCKIVQHVMVPPLANLRGQAERSLATSAAAQVKRLNELLFEAAGAKVSWVELDQLADAKGRVEFSSARYYFTSRMPFAPQFLPDYLAYFRAAWRTANAKAKKVLALDLDNTVWGGIIGDDGQEGIKLGTGSPDGEAFADWGHHVRELAARGVILAICSKNNPDLAADGLNHPQAVLKRDDFAAAQISWDDKATGLRRLAAELNVGIDSFVFADDNPFECELIREQLPDVGVVELGTDPSQFIALLEAGRWFDLPAYSKEDFSRAEAYQARAAAEADRQSAGDIDSYLRGLNMVGRLYAATDSDLVRLAQMEQKTNQFNMTTRRYSEDDLRSFMSRDDMLTMAFELRDRHADHGLVSSLVGTIEGNTLQIDSWLMSCRVFSRTSEEFIFGQLLEQIERRGVKKIVGFYTPTKKNGVVAELYGRLGFEKVASDGSTWEFDVATVSAETRPKTFIDTPGSEPAAAPAPTAKKAAAAGSTQPAATAPVQVAPSPAAETVEPPKAPSFDGQSTKDLLARAEAESHGQTLAQAALLWHEVVRREPENNYAHVRLIQVLRDLGRVDEADAHVRELLGVHDAGLHFQFATNSVARQDWQEAYRRWSDALERFPTFAEPRYGMAEAAWKQGRLVHAEDLLAANDRQFPTYIPSGLLLADIKGQRGNWRDSAEFLRVLDERIDDRPELGIRRAIALANAGDVGAARKVINNSAKRFPSAAIVSEYQNWVATLNNDWKAAYDGAVKLLDTARGTPQTIAIARQAAFHLGKSARRSLVIYGNCQAAVLDGLLTRLEVLYPEFDIVTILGHVAEDAAKLTDPRIRNAAVYWEQYDERAEVPMRDHLRALIPSTALKLVFPSISMFSLWPFNWPDTRSHAEPRFPHGRYPYDGDVIGQDVAKEGLRGERAYQRYMDLARGRLGNLQAQFDRDIGTLRKRDDASDVKMVDYVLANYRKHPMFYTWGHVSGQSIMEIGSQLLRLSHDRLGSPPAERVNQLFSLPTSISDFWMPIHPDVAKWHKLEYCQGDKAVFNIYGNWWTFKEFMVRYIEYDTSW